MKLPLWHVLLLVLFLTQGCGFHLRGGAPQAPEPRAYRVYISAGQVTELGAMLGGRLLEAGNRVQTSAAAADFILALSEPQFETRALSVSPETGKAEEYQVVFSARVGIARAGAEAESMTIRITSDYIFDEQAMLGNLAEEEALKAALLRQAVTRILRRLNTLAAD